MYMYGKFQDKLLGDNGRLLSVQLNDTRASAQRQCSARKDSKLRSQQAWKDVAMF